MAPRQRPCIVSMAISQSSISCVTTHQLAYTIRNQGRSAVIGVGGGRDVLSAYLFGFRDITGVELNPIFIDFLTREFATTITLLNLPGVRLFVDEARSWFARTNEHFRSDRDEPHRHLGPPTGAGAYSLSETRAVYHPGLASLSVGVDANRACIRCPLVQSERHHRTGRLLSLAAQHCAKRASINLSGICSWAGLIACTR